MLIYYFGICLYEIGYDDEFIELINSFAEIFYKFNSKTDSISVEEIDGIYKEKINNMVNKFIPYVTIKIHSLKHYTSNIIKRGFFWNWSGKFFFFVILFF